MAELVLTLSLLTFLTSFDPKPDPVPLINPDLNFKTKLDIIASLYFFQEKHVAIKKHFSTRIVLKEKGLFTVTYILAKMRKIRFPQREKALKFFYP